MKPAVVSQASLSCCLKISQSGIQGRLADFIKANSFQGTGMAGNYLYLAMLYDTVLLKAVPL